MVPFDPHSLRRLSLAGTCIPALLLAAGINLARAEAPLVANGAESAGGVDTIHLEELWRIGGEDDEENLLGVIDKALADDEGNLFLLDIQLVEAMVFDNEGQYLHSLGKQGDGPGELRRVTDLIFLADGTVGLVQSFPGRIVKVGLDGIPAGELRPGGDDPTEGGFFALRGAAAVGSQLVLAGARMSRDETTRTAHNFIARYDDSGGEGIEYLGKTTSREMREGLEIDEAAEFFPHDGGWALGLDGRVFTAPDRNEYRIEVRDPQGRLERTITREYKSWKRTSAELDRARELMMPFRRRNRGGINLVMQPTERDILAMRVDDEGNLWVLPSRGVRETESGIHSVWDVFDSTGSFAKQVALACEGTGEKDAVFFPGGDLVVIVKEHADALFAFRGRGADDPTTEEDDTEASPLEVICYRLPS